MLSSVETKEGQASKRGVEYEVANGIKIPNLGEQKFVGHTTVGYQKQIKSQVCDVTKPLASVARICDKGNRVVFKKLASYIENVSTGEVTWLSIAIHQDVQHTCQVCHQNVQWRADTITDHLHTHQLSPSQYWAANMPGYRSLYCIHVENILYNFIL